MNDTPTIIHVPQKSMLIALLLAAFIPGLGLLYSTVLGAIVMSFVYMVVLGINVFTLFIFSPGFGIPLVISLVWAAIAVNSYNNKAIDRATGRR